MPAPRTSRSITTRSIRACSSCPWGDDLMQPGFAVPGLIAGILCGGVSVIPADLPVTDADLRLFDYDRSQKLGITESAPRQEGEITLRDLSYASPKGGRVTATLFAPASGGPRLPGSLLMHGLPSNRAGMQNMAANLARAGAVCLTIDAPWARADRIKEEPQAITF